LILVVVAAISTHLMLLIVKCKYKLKQQQQHQQVHTYGDIGSILFGKKGLMIVNIALVLSQTSFCIACKQ
jgi:proton-coupled amino acid transporter